jgi:hypothetical protein
MCVADANYTSVELRAVASSTVAWCCVHTGEHAAPEVEVEALCRAGACTSHVAPPTIDFWHQNEFDE